MAAAGRYRQLIDALRAAVRNPQPQVMTAALLVLNLNTVVESGGQIHRGTPSARWPAHADILVQPADNIGSGVG